MSHLTSTALDRVRRGDASAEETAAVGRHVRECADCEALAAEQLAIVDCASAFEAAFTLDDDGADVDANVRTMRPRVVAFWASAAAAAAVAIFFVIPRPRESRPVAPPTVRIAPPSGAPRVVEARPEWDALVAKTRATRSLPFPADIRELASPDAFRGEAREGTGTAMWPIATAVDDVHPELRWHAVEGARYVVTLTSRGELLARSDALTTPRWRVPIALQRDEWIRWQVRVEKGEATSILPAPPAPPAIFRVISAEEHDEIARVLAERPEDQLLIGLLYARAGMVDDARRALAASHDPLASQLVEQLP